jgi:hypothetical protein
MIAVLVLLAMVVLRLVVLGGLAWALLPRGRSCPACGAETVAVERTGLVRMVPGVTRRWCMVCGWSWYRKIRLAESLPITLQHRLKSRV